MPAPKKNAAAEKLRSWRATILRQRGQLLGYRAGRRCEGGRGSGGRAVQSQRGATQAPAAHPNRFAGFAAVALQDVRAAGDELERAVSQLGFKGAMINGYSNIGDMDTAQYLDEPPVWDFWPAWKHSMCPSTCIAFLDDALIFGAAAATQISAAQSPAGGVRNDRRARSSSAARLKPDRTPERCS